MKKLFFLIPILLFYNSVFSQSKPDTVYIYFDKSSSEKYETNAISKDDSQVDKYRKKEESQHIFFYIKDELFIYNKNEGKIDTCNIKFLSMVTIRDLNYLNHIGEELKSTYFFKKGVFDKIYLLEQNKNKIIKYDVTWATDLVLK